MTSVEIKKKFFAYRQYKLRGVDQVEWEKQSPLHYYYYYYYYYYYRCYNGDSLRWIVVMKVEIPCSTMIQITFEIVIKSSMFRHGYNAYFNGTRSTI